MNMCINDSGVAAAFRQDLPAYEVPTDDFVGSVGKVGASARPKAGAAPSRG